MKFLVFTDNHGERKFIKKIKNKIRKERVDFLICCGDFTMFGHDINRKLNDINKLKIPCYLIHGNHESEEQVKDLCHPFHNIHFIHNHTLLLDYHVSNENGYFVPIRLFGLGGDGFLLNNPDFKKQTKEWLKNIKKNNSEECKIFITHAPPHNTELDVVSGGHCGNKEIKEFIQKAKVDLAFCGHIHENENITQVIDKSLIINPGPEGMIIEL